MFQKTCKTALGQIQAQLANDEKVSKTNLVGIDENIQKIFEIAQINQKNRHAGKMKAWTQKIQNKHIDLHTYVGDTKTLPYSQEGLRKRYTKYIYHVIDFAV